MGFQTLLLSILIPLQATAATQQWEICLDKANFSFSASTSLRGDSTSVKKEGCKMEFTVIGGKGERYSVDLCAAYIHIDAYSSIEAKTPERVGAGSAACPSPLFGADFDANKKTFTAFRQKRKRVLELWEKIYSYYGAGVDKVNLSDPNSFSPAVSAGKIACGNYLLREYLERCMSFEAKTK